MPSITSDMSDSAGCPIRATRVARQRLLIPALFATAVISIVTVPARGQLPGPRFGEVVPRDVREMYDRGMQYLAKTQGEKGDWATGGGEAGPGTTGMALMVFLACGEDPNFGPYSNQVRRALRSIIEAQDSTTGIMGMSMYHHGFATLALAEAYGAVDDRNLWPDGKGPRSIGQALELAVRGAVTSQKKNPHGAWRYSPDARDADTSVSGAVFVGLLAARNAGIEVPDEAINKAISFYAHMTSASGEVAYAGGMGGFGESAGPQLDRDARLLGGPPQGLEAVQGDARLPQAAHRSDPAASLAGICPLLRGPGTLSGRRGGVGEMEQAAGPSTETGPGHRRQFPRPTGRIGQHVAVAPGVGGQFSFLADL